MASASIYYKFKSQKEPSRITFDGTGMSVWDLKREIILQNKMGRGTDFDLGVYNADTNEEYKDDNFLVPRSTQVIVRRLPPSKPGRGSAQMYVADVNGAADSTGASRFAGTANAGGVKPTDAKAAHYRGPMTMRFDGSGKDPQAGASSSSASAPSSAPTNSAAAAGTGDEADKIAAMFQASSAQWDETQERMSHATYRDRSGQIRRGGPPRPLASQRPQHVPDRPPPTGYICFRCGKPGHWIQDCPTNDDREYDNRPRFKRTTGIPKSMLKTVEQPTDEEHRAGVMLTADGTYVVAQVDQESWRKNHVRTKPLTQSDVYQSAPTDATLACPLCSKLLREAVKTPCCGTRYCEECIQTHLLEHEFTCAECERRIPDLMQLKPDEEVRKRVKEYIKETIEQSEREIEEGAKRENEDDSKSTRDVTAAHSKAGSMSPSQRSHSPPRSNHNGDDGAGDRSGNNSTDLSYGEGMANNGNSGNGNMMGNMGMAFNPQVVQNIMMMLQNPALPPPMRMQLQMQLQMQQMAYMTQMQQGGHAGNPGMGHMAMGPMGMMPGMSWGQQQAAQATNPFSHRNPPTNEGSAYLRNPVNQSRNVRPTTTKRDRPTDFVESQPSEWWTTLGRRESGRNLSIFPASFIMYTKALAPVVLAAGMAWQAMAVTTDDHNYQLRCKPEMQGVVCGSLKPDTDYNSLSVEETYTSFNNGVHWSADLRYCSSFVRLACQRVQLPYFFIPNHLLKNTGAIATMQIKLFVPLVAAAALMHQASAYTIDEHNYDVRCSPPAEGVLCGVLRAETNFGILQFDEPGGNNVHFHPDTKKFAMDCLEGLDVSIWDGMRNRHIISTAGTLSFQGHTCCQVRWYNNPQRFKACPGLGCASYIVHCSPRLAHLSKTSP
ncbi:hypothetical protein BCV70DRAFT_203632 [Testicularia cyperi]|uniref:DWNN-domain-containing protein n=1 Tax=Testicularia cyperi TaxID=1882483 RepID=A0A317XY63_9BASI|nr:hypothetical protein BCV70DRAFT_203632 [Testicularia cyperi]